MGNIMSCESQLHVGDKNFTFAVTITEDCQPIDISSATDIDIIFSKPDGTSVIKSAVFVTDGTDGKIKYITIDNDIDQAGVWKIQAVVTLGTGSLYHSAVKTFKVFCNIG
jgi:hypothetical protein